MLLKGFFMSPVDVWKPPYATFAVTIRQLYGSHTAIEGLTCSTIHTENAARSLPSDNWRHGEALNCTNAIPWFSYGKQTHGKPPERASSMNVELIEAQFRQFIWLWCALQQYKNVHERSSRNISTFKK